jgi:hypothetical protein
MTMATTRRRCYELMMLGALFAAAVLLSGCSAAEHHRLSSRKLHGGNGCLSGGFYKTATGCVACAGAGDALTNAGE